MQRKSGLPRETVEDFLLRQDVYSKHKPIRHKFPRRRVFSPGIDHQWQADLVELGNPRINKGFNQILTVIDVFSKYAFAVPLKNKSAESIIKAFQEIFKERKPKKFIQTDHGREFNNQKFKTFLQQYNIEWFATKNFDTKAQIVERFNRTIKEKMWKCFTSLGVTANTAKWVDLLPKLIKNYNNTYHNSIKMTPTEASQPQNESTVYLNLYSKTQSTQAEKFQVGDNIRITRLKSHFNKGYLPNFGSEIFTINQVFKGPPKFYEIVDENGEIIEGKFYGSEMTKVIV